MSLSANKAPKTVSTSFHLQILVSQKLVIPSVLPAPYLGKILRWESNDWVRKGQYEVTMQGHPHAVWFRVTEPTPAFPQPQEQQQPSPGRAEKL